MKVLCEKYKSLIIADQGVQFADGRAEVTDKQAEAFKAMPDSFGFQFIDSKPKKAAKDSKPKKEAKEE